MNRERLLTYSLLLMVMAGVLSLDFAVCPVAGIGGIPCPSCGLTRATVALVQGDVSRANAIHPGVLPVLGYLAILFGTSKYWRTQPNLVKLMSAGGVALLGALTLLWAARFFGHFGGPVAVHPWR